MKKKVFVVIGLTILFPFILFLITSCLPEKCPECRECQECQDCQECPPDEAIAVNIENAIAVNRDNLPADLLDIYYSTRPDQGKTYDAPYIANELILIGSPEQLDLLEGNQGFQTIITTTANGDEIRLIDTSNFDSTNAAEIAIKNDKNFAGIRIGKNYLIAAPWDIEGEPWDIEGEPDGSQTSGTFTLTDATGNVHDFPWDQWAFRESGIKLFGNNGISFADNEDINGEGVRVIIFDTSPLPEQDGITSDNITETMNFTETIKVSFADNVLTDVISLENDQYSGTNEHGLFVAGLVHYVAPKAEIELVKILNNKGVGDIYTLIAELEKLLADNNNNLDNVVINLSLGFRLHNSSEASATADDAMIESLRILFEKLSEAGAIVVAAAGNHSSVFEKTDSAGQISSLHQPEKTYEIKSQVNPPLISNYPAMWNTVISVSGYGGESVLIDEDEDDEKLPTLSCFSNEIPSVPDDPENLDEKKVALSILAPSGDGYQALPSTYEFGKPVVYTCQSPRAACDDNDSDEKMLMSGYSCPYTIVSLTTRGYAHWAGTSFGTPIVSGIVALMLDKCDSTDKTSAAFQEWLVGKFYENDLNKFDMSSLVTDGGGCP